MGSVSGMAGAAGASLVGVPLQAPALLRGAFTGASGDTAT